MKRNVAGQTVSAQMVNATTGADFTSTVNVRVTKDGGTQTAGGGTVTHKGNGEHSYAPTMAETDAAQVLFQFYGTGAVTQGIQTWPSFPQTVDSAADLATLTSRLSSARAGYLDNLSVGAVAQAGALTTAQTDLTTLIARLTALRAGYLDNLSAGAAATAAAVAALPTAAAIADAVCDEATSGHLTAGTVGKALSDAGTAAGTVATNLNATVSSRSSSAEVTTVGSAVAAVAALVGALPTAVAIRDAVMVYAIEAGETYEATIKNMAAVLTGATEKAGDVMTWKSRAGVARVVGSIIAGVRTISSRSGT